MNSAPPKRSLPGDFIVRNKNAAALRVDHAGEYGATRIYAGQLAVLKGDARAQEIKHMAAQEAVHLAAFKQILPEHGVRPTLLLPLWHIGGWLMGAVSAAMGSKAAMACTVAVEEVITAHYTEQLESGAVSSDLHGTIAKFRDEEMEHRAIGLANDAESTPVYGPLSAAIRSICRAAIWVSARL